MAGAGLSRLPGRFARGTLDTWRKLAFEQRVAGVGATLLIISTFGPFSFIEGAIVVLALAVLLLLRRRAQGREFHVPFGDGTIIAAAGAWAAVLILIRLFDRPLGQGLLALACAAIVFVAGLSERRKRLPDDLPVPDPEAHQRSADATEPLADWDEVDVLTTHVRDRPRRRREASPATAQGSDPLPPPEYHPPGRPQADHVEPGRPEPERAEPEPPEPGRVEPGRPEPERAEPQRPEPERADPGRPDARQLELGRPEPEPPPPADTTG